MSDTAVEARPELARPLDGMVALVTGSARNIGRAIALDLARSGAAVVVNARASQDEADATVRAIEDGGGQALAHLADVTDPGAVTAMVEAAVTRFGRLDILVNNAAIRRETPFPDLTYAEWREVLSITLDAAFLTAHAAHPHLARSGRGAIVNIGGLSAHTGAAGRAHVVAAKAGLVGLTRALAHDLAPDGITVNCVAPGLIDTVRGASAAPNPSHHARQRAPLGRRGTPQEVAALVRTLVGPEARYVTGQTLHANGGAFMP